MYTALLYLLEQTVLCQGNTGKGGIAEVCVQPPDTGRIVMTFIEVAFLDLGINLQATCFNIGTNPMHTCVFKFVHFKFFLPL